jgi:hypothetical protein
MSRSDPFVAADDGTDVRAYARTLRGVWEAAHDGGRGPLCPRAVIEQSWRRLARAGLDRERLRPRTALDADALAQTRESSALAGVLTVLRRSLGALAQDAEHVMVICDADGRILWLEGHARVKEEAADRITFAEGMLWTEESAGTRSGPPWRSTVPSRSSRPSTSSPSSTRGGAQPRRCTTRPPAPLAGPRRLARLELVVADPVVDGAA